MKVAIVGFGFVGKALFYSLRDTTDSIKIDPQLNTSISDLQLYNPNIIFICIPTPMKDDGSQDINAVYEAIDEINGLLDKPLIVIKSTVLPSYASEIHEKYSNTVFNPEFLREKYANEDFINSESIIFGGTKQNCLKASSFYKQHTNCIQQNHIFTDVISACLIKYSINSYLATKVVFFNELKKIFEKTGSSENWDKFIDHISSDTRIGKSHMSVPGPDGRYGFGGACFPKDTAALHKFSESLNAEFMLLKKAININNNIRSEYNDLIDREKDQNIKYKD